MAERPSSLNRRRKIPLLVRFRTLLLLGAFGLAAAVGALYYYGGGLEPSRGAGQPVQGGSSTPEGVTSLSKGFDYTQFDEGRPLFRIRGATHTLDANQDARLEGVEIQLFQASGKQLSATSRKAVYQREKNAAELEGDVHLVGQDGFELWTEKLIVGENGERVSSAAPVRFRYGEQFEGEALSLRVEVPARVFLLQGEVTMRGRPKEGQVVDVAADRAFFEEERRLLRGEGNPMRLTFGDEFVEAKRISVYLADDADVVSFVRAKWEVRGRARPRSAQLAGSGPIGFAAEGASLLMDPTGQELRKIELEAGDRAASLDTVDPVTKNRRSVTANYLAGDFGTGQIAGVQAFGQVRLYEEPASPETGSGAPLREARAERGEASLDAGNSLEIVTLTGSVEYQEPRMRVTSQRARLNLRDGNSQFLGEPAAGRPARLVGQEGEVTAAKLVYQRDRQLLIATGESRVSLDVQDGAGFSGPLLRSGDGPVWVEAEESRFNRSTDRTVFLGKVRAWRGRDLLLADELTVQRRTERLEAKGNVKTVWHPETAAKTPAAAKSVAPAGLASDMLEITAREFAYSGDERRLRYVGDVVVLDGPRTMRCGRTEVELAPKKAAGAAQDRQEIETLDCLETAVLIDRAQGREASGERALYEPGDGRIRIWGEPVTLKDRRGGQTQGQLLIYRLTDGAVEFGRAEPGRADPGPGAAKAEAGQ